MGSCSPLERGYAVSWEIFAVSLFIIENLPLKLCTADGRLSMILGIQYRAGSHRTCSPASHKIDRVVERTCIPFLKMDLLGLAEDPPPAAPSVVSHPRSLHSTALLPPSSPLTHVLSPSLPLVGHGQSHPARIFLFLGYYLA